MNTTPGTGTAEEIDLRRYVRVVWRRRWLVALTFAIAAAAALGLSTQRTPQYSATAKVFIGPRSVASGDFGNALQELNFSEDFIASYAELIKSRPLIETVGRRLDLDEDAVELRKRVRTSILTDTRIIEVSFTDESPRRARDVVNALAATFVSDTLQEFGGRTAVSANVYEPALEPENPVSPKPLRDGVLGGILGLMLGLGVAFLLEQMDTTFKGREDVEGAIAPLPLLAVIPRVEDPAVNGREIYVESRPKAPPAEAFRMLRTNIQFLGVDKPIRTILVTSPYAEDGKTTTAANLAGAMAAAGYKTLLLESDLRRPMVHAYLNAPLAPGLTDVLVGRMTLRQASRPTRFPRLAIVPAGQIPPNPAEILGSHRMKEVLEEARETADMIVLDTPPALPVTDAAVLAPHADGVVLVLRAGRTHREKAREALATFDRLGVRVLGVVLNDVPSGDAYGYYYSRYYKDRDDEDTPRQAAPTSVRPARGGSRGDWSGDDETALIPAPPRAAETQPAPAGIDLSAVEESPGAIAYPAAPRDPVGSNGDAGGTAANGNGDRSTARERFADVLSDLTRDRAADEEIIALADDPEPVSEGVRIVEREPERKPYNPWAQLADDD